VLRERETAPVTAILALSYSIAVGVLHAMKHAGILLRTTGFIVIDEMEFATLLPPPVTTLSQPADRLARLAFDRLLSPIHGEADRTTHIMLEGELITRESSGCPRVG
jgi:LacI family transcriptional regulator